LRKTPRLWIEKYPSIRRMYETITGPRRMGSPATAENYIHGVRRFVSFLGYEDPETVLEKIRRGEIDALRMVDMYIDYALERYAHKTVRSQVFGVKKWLETNGVFLNWKKIEMPTVTEIQEEDRAPTREELKILLHHAKSARDRAVILMLVSSGLRVGTLLSLTVGDVNFNYPDVARINVYRRRGRKFVTKRGGGGRFYCTFITPEAKQALIQYLKEREKAGEKITDSSPLITDAYHTGKFITTEDWQRVYYRILRKAGLNVKSKRWYVYHIHSLRKYFRSNCVGVDPSYREFWMGHKGGYLDESYFRAEEEKHLAEYRKAIPYLTVYSAPQDESWKMAIRAIARIQGRLEEEKLRRLEEILARAKNMDEAIEKFRRLQEEPDPPRKNSIKIVKGDQTLIKHLEEGWTLIKELNHDKYLLKF